MDPRLRAALIGALALAHWAWAAEASAEVWRYTDEQGRVRFTDMPTNVPERQRESLERMTIEHEPRAEADAAPAAPREGARSALEERLLAGTRDSWRPADLEVFQGFLDTWGLAFMLSGIPWAAVVFTCWIHSLQRRRFVWLITNTLAWVVSMPLYILFRLDPLGTPARLGVLALWSAPFVVGALMFRAFFQMAGAMSLS